MDKNLSQSAKEIGKALITALDNGINSPTSALWLYNSQDWILVLAMDSILGGNDQLRDDIAQDIINEVKKLNAGEVKFSLIDRSDKFISNLSMMVQTGRKDIGSITFNNNTVNGMYIEAAYIYRISL